MEARLLEKFRLKTLELRRLIKSYDDAEIGDTDSLDILSGQMAAAIFILVENRGRNQVSLLSRLKIDAMLSFPDTAPPLSLSAPNHNLPLAVICFPKGAGQIYFSPRGIRNNCPRHKLVDWWSSPSVGYGSGMTRSKLISIIRDKEGGGGHIDAEVRDKDYLTLLRGGLPEMYYRRAGADHALYIGDQLQFYWGSQPSSVGAVAPEPSGDPIGIRNGAFASVRQIAGELEYALSDAGF